MEIVNHEYYVSFEVAKLLKKAGFDWEVNHSYPDRDSLDNSCSGYMEDLPFYHNLNDGNYGGMSVPTIEVAQRWLREVKNIRLFVEGGNEYYTVESYIHYKNYWCQTGICHNGLEYERFNTYEEALETGIKKALELILEEGE